MSPDEVLQRLIQNARVADALREHTDKQVATLLREAANHMDMLSPTHELMVNAAERLERAWLGPLPPEEDPN